MAKGRLPVGDSLAQPQTPWCKDSGDRAKEYLRSVGVGPAAVQRPRGMPTVAMTLYLTDQPPPDDLTTSIRCVVLDHGRVLVCDTPDGPHIVPGGRRELGESWEETARREVHEETGFEVEALFQIGVMLLRQDGERPGAPFHTYPHPDCFWVAFGAQARSAPAEAWADSEGWETGSELHRIADALQMDLSPIDSALLRAAALTRGDNCGR